MFGNALIAQYFYQGFCLKKKSSQDHVLQQDETTPWEKGEISIKTDMLDSYLHVTKISQFQLFNSIFRVVSLPGRFFSMKKEG